MNLHKLIKASPLSPDFSEKEFEIDLPSKCPLLRPHYDTLSLNPLTRTNL